MLYEGCASNLHMCAASPVVQGSDGTVGANKEAIKIIAKGDDTFAQVCAGLCSSWLTCVAAKLTCVAAVDKLLNILRT